MISYLSYNVLYLYYIILKYIEWLRNTVSKCNRFPFHSHIRPPWSHRRQAGQVRGLGLWTRSEITTPSSPPVFVVVDRGFMMFYDHVSLRKLWQFMQFGIRIHPDSKKKPSETCTKAISKKENKMNNSQHFRQALARSFFSVVRLSAAHEGASEAVEVSISWNSGPNARESKGPLPFNSDRR